MIHPQPTVVLMLLWREGRVGVSRDDLELQEFVTPEHLNSSTNRARAFRVLTDTQDARTAARRPRLRLRLQRRGPVAVRRPKRIGRPACLGQRPVRSGR
jgi:hypothetical protein